MYQSSSSIFENAMDKSILEYLILWYMLLELIKDYTS